MRRHQRNREGRIKAKIRALMLEAGWDVTLWWEQQGDYRIHGKWWDVATWGCHARPIDGNPVLEACSNGDVMMACWTTMGRCAKFGLTVEFHGRDGWEIDPKPVKIKNEERPCAGDSRHRG